jgi:hypothetical protein
VSEGDLERDHFVRISIMVRNVAIAAAGIVVYAAAATRPAAAAECRAVSTIAASAVASANTGSGGHLLQHITGQTPPPGTSQNTKSLFSSVADWNKAWSGYVNTTKITAVKCSTGQAQQTVPLSKLNITTAMTGRSCTAAGANGVCSTSSTFAVAQVFFGFIYNTTAKKWILNTAFPQP